MRDYLSETKVLTALAPVVVGDNTVQNGVIIDRQGFDGLTFVIALGVLADADATFAVTITQGDDSALADGVAVGTYDTVPVGGLTLANFDFSADGAARKIGYIGGNRYVRLTITPANNTGAAPISAMALLEGANIQPTSNP